jgi:DNA-binding IclR family transcriptional regulator
MTTSDRLLNVLALFTMATPQWTVEAASAELGITVSTTYRYFKSLVKAGLVIAYSPGRYVLGPAIIQYDRQMRLLDPLITAGGPVMDKLAESLPPQTVLLLCRLYQADVMCVHQVFLQRPDFAVSYERGRPMPLYRGSASKVILANLPARIVKAQQASHAADMEEAGLGDSWEAVRQTLKDIRAAGVFASQGDLDRARDCIAAPIFSPDRQVIGSLSTVTPARLRKQLPVPEVSDLLMAGARQIEAGLLVADATHRAITAASTEEVLPRRRPALKVLGGRRDA